MVRITNPGKLSQLRDVTISSPADNELLAYDNSSSEWINQTPTEAGLDAIYLKLDASNDPVTGDLLLTPTADSTSVLQVTKSDTTVVLNVDTTNAITTASGRLIVDGVADVVQVTIQAHSSQAANILEIQDSVANVQVSVDGSGGAVFNEEGNDADFRVEASGVDNALFVQGSDGFVGINTGTPKPHSM